MTPKTLKINCSNEKAKAASELINPSGLIPAHAEVVIYFSQKGMTIGEAEMFFTQCEARQWLYSNGEPIGRWKQAARLWITDFLEKHPWLFDRNIR